MCTCSSLLKVFTLQIILIFISFFMTISEGKTVCPFIETLSFGSDFNIKCNNSYLIINEINIEGLNWKFVNQSSTCDQDGSQQGPVNQCGIRPIGSNYLAVPLKSLENNEEACAYCRINYKPIAPMIHVVQSVEDQHTSYRFNLTATGLAKDESFEILWAKRVHNAIRHSYNYWFLQGCVDSLVKILVNTAHTIIFTTDDTLINRVEFIIRRCDGTCRTYDTCEQQQFTKEIESNYFKIPDSIEKISCDLNCLNGLTTPPSLPIMTHRPHKTSTASLTTSKSPPNIEQIIKITILVVSIVILLSIILIIFIRCVICKPPNGKKHVYAKTSNVDPDEQK